MWAYFAPKYSSSANGVRWGGGGSVVAFNPLVLGRFVPYGAFSPVCWEMGIFHLNAVPARGKNPSQCRQSAQFPPPPELSPLFIPVCWDKASQFHFFHFRTSLPNSQVR